MFDIKLIRDDRQTVEKDLQAKGAAIDLGPVLKYDTERRKLLTQLEELRGQKNAANDEISLALKEKKDPKKKIASMKTIAHKIDALEPKVKKVPAQISDILIGIPNLPHPSVPVGGAEKNKEVRRWGELARFDFTPKTHIEIAQALDIIDFERGAKIAGSHFILYKKQGARLVRALFNFMLDVHTGEHGYTEVFTPVLVNRAAMTGTGQLPKMAEDMYFLPDDDLYLIPT